LNKLHLLYQTQHRFILIMPNMYTTCFGPFLGVHQACQYKNHPKNIGVEVYVCNRAAQKMYNIN